MSEHYGLATHELVTPTSKRNLWEPFPENITFTRHGEILVQCLTTTTHRPLGTGVRLVGERVLYTGPGLGRTNKSLPLSFSQLVGLNKKRTPYGRSRSSASYTQRLRER